MGMVGTLVLGNAGMSAASPCMHDNTRTGIIQREISGYDHYYNSPTGTKSCSVIVYYEYSEKWCVSCGALVSSSYIGTKEEHSHPNHD